MNITSTQGDASGWRVVVVGELDVSTAAALLDELATVAAREPDVVLLDLTNASFIDSTGLRSIIEGHRLVTTAGGELFIDGVSAAAGKLLEIMGLVERFRRP